MSNDEACPNCGRPLTEVVVMTVPPSYLKMCTHYTCSYCVEDAELKIRNKIKNKIDEK